MKIVTYYIIGWQKVCLHTLTFHNFGCFKSLWSVVFHCLTSHVQATKYAWLTSQYKLNYWLQTRHVGTSMKGLVMRNSNIETSSQFSHVSNTRKSSMGLKWLTCIYTEKSWLDKALCKTLVGNGQPVCSLSAWQCCVKPKDSVIFQKAHIINHAVI